MDFIDYREKLGIGFNDRELENMFFNRIFNVLDELDNTVLLEEDFERIKKVVWGDYIRSFNDIEGYAHTFLTALFTEEDYFEYPRVFKTVTFEDIKNRFKKSFVRERAALSVVKPSDK